MRISAALLAPLFAPLLFLLAGCTAPEFRTREAVTDTRLDGVWLIKKAELAGKNLPMPPNFELHISGTQYRAGVVANGAPPNDRGKLILFGDELAGQAARMDVVGEEGPNKGKRYPAIYRFTGNAGRELDICYDLSEAERPSEFATREGTKLLRVTYSKK